MLCSKPIQRKPQRGAAEGRPPLWRRPKAASFVLALSKAHVLALNTAHVLRLNKADVLALNKAHVLRLNKASLFGQVVFLGKIKACLSVEMQDMCLVERQDICLVETQAMCCVES